VDKVPVPFLVDGVLQLSTIIIWYLFGSWRHRWPYSYSSWQFIRLHHFCISLTAHCTTSQHKCYKT